MSATIQGQTITFSRNTFLDFPQRARSYLRQKGFGMEMKKSQVVLTSPEGWTFQETKGLRGRQIVTFIDGSGVPRGKYEYEDGASDDFGGICQFSLLSTVKSSDASP